MGFSGWTTDCFEAMELPGFAERMQAIRSRVRPRLEAISQALAAPLSRHAGLTLYPHVALHARRTVNPPDDTWCAWSAARTGYKKHPHLQLGIRARHVYVQAGAILEAPFRSRLSELLLQEGRALAAQLPGQALWKDDHLAPHGVPTEQLSDADIERLAAGLRRKSRGDFMVALHWPKEQALAMGPQEFLEQALQGLVQLLPVFWLVCRAADEQAGSGASHAVHKEKAASPGG